MWVDTILTYKNKSPPSTWRAQKIRTTTWRHWNLNKSTKAWGNTKVNEKKRNESAQWAKQERTQRECTTFWRRRERMHLIRKNSNFETHFRKIRLPILTTFLAKSVFGISWGHHSLEDSFPFNSTVYTYFPRKSYYLFLFYVFPDSEGMAKSIVSIHFTNSQPLESTFYVHFWKWNNTFQN